MAVKAKQQYYADNVTLKKEAREFGMIDELKEKLDSVEWGAQVNVIEEVQENGVPLEIVDKTVNVLVPEVIDNLYTIDPNNSLSAKQGKILYDMIKNLLSRGRFLSTWNTATGLPLTNPEESPYQYKAGDYYIVGVTAQEGGTNFRPEPVEYVINVASDEQETSEVHVSDIYVYDGEKWILLINSTRELAVDDYVDYTYQSTNPVENQAIARELVKKQNIFHYIGNTAPTPQNEGDEWYDTANDKLKVWDGTQWNEVGNGDTYTAGLHISIDPNDNNKISVVEWSATASGLGLVKLGSDTVQSTSPNNVTSTTGRTYRIQANGSGQLMVNVPWTDTTYSAGTGIAISNNRVISCTVKPVTVGPTAPSTPGTGDLWYDTNKNTMFLYKNNTWTIIGPEIYPITKADYDALTPAEQGDGRFFLITDNDGTIYVDWENVQNRPMYIGTTSPANPCEGYLWYDTTNDVLKIYNGTQWNEVGGGTTYTAGNGISISNDEISIDTTVVATKTDLNSKQNVFHTTSSLQPSNPSEGDEWYDTADDVLKVYDGSNWIVTGKTYTAGDGINIDTSNNNEISVDLNDIVGDGLYVDGNSNLSLDKNNIIGDGLEIDSNNKLKVDPNDFVNTSNGLTIDNNGDIDISTYTIAMNLDGDGLSVNGSTNKLDVYPMDFVNTLHGLTVDNNGDIDIDSSTLATNLEGDGLSYNGSTNKLDVYPMEFVNTSNGLTIDSNGDIDVDTSTLTTNLAGHGLSVNGSTNKLDVYPIEIAGNGLTANGDVLDVYPMAFVETSNGLTIDSNEKVDIDTATLATNLAGTGLYYDSTNNNISIDATEVAMQKDLASKQDKAESGSGAPTTTPTYVGQVYIDTTNDNMYVATGTSSSSDWTAVDTNTTYTAGDGITISNNTISADTNVLATKTDLSGKQDKATSGSTAPSTTPSYVGQQYIDTTADKMYVATGTSSSNDWTEVGAGSGDMLYSDFGWDTLTGASVTLALRSEITPSANFTVNKPNDLKDGQFYVLRVITGATAYTMTLGTDVTNPYSEDLTLSANTIANFTFLAKDGELELQPSTDVPSYTAGDGIDITNNEISVDVTDIIGNGLSEDANNNIIVDSTIVALKSDLSNYYTKTQTYSKTEVDNLIASVGSFEVVATLPSVDTADTKKIYLLGPIGTGADKYEEYIVTESEGVKSWTKIGETSMDLSNYVTSTQLATTLQNYATTTALATKQDTLTAGTNIQISNNVISATDTKYTAGTNITIDANNVISATDTTYTAGDGIDITNNVISADLVAGTGINLSGGTCVTESDRKGPCPSGFHVPALTEWQGLKTIMTSVSGSGASYWISNLHMPLAGARYSANGGRISYGMRGNYQSSTPYKSLALVSGVVDDSHGNSESEGYSIRAFKNEFVVPDSSWTVVNGTLGNAGIFWDQTNGLISITSNGTTGYTMQDKNLGATVVYNNGDTLTAANCGNLYQWGNNYGFSWDGTLTTSSTKVDASDYGPGNYYSSSTFITTESGDNSWSSVRNDNLWGNTSNSTHQECVYAPITISSTVNGFNPSNTGTEGQVLTKTSTGYDWANAQGGGGNVIAMTQAEYNALTTEEKNDGKLRIITDAPTEDISVDWANIANKPIELSTQSGNTLTSLKIWVGSQTDYEALATKDASTLYFTTNVVS